jgi:hypothetical protein
MEAGQQEQPEVEEVAELLDSSTHMTVSPLPLAIQSRSQLDKVALQV